jgi:hypothetical protein
MLSEKVEANERIRATQVELGLGDGDRLPFLCECDDVTCRVLIRLTADEYGDMRAAGHRVCVVGHPCDGRIVTTGDGYVVTEE